MLKGFAVLPADTFADGPPAGEGISANGRTGPFEGQPVQGFSGVQFAPNTDGKFWFLSDNGFGAEGNSSDYLLRVYQLDPDFAGTEAGDASVVVEDFIQLSDPDNLISFPITNEDMPERLLTGADFDIESFVIDGEGDIWVGDEFGPYLLHFNEEGELLEAPIPTPSFTQLNTLNGQDPLVIAHRGASGDFPEHTLEAYEAGIAQGADFIEPDLAITSDGVLIARHEPTLAQVELDENGEILLDGDGNPIVKQDSTLTTNVADLPQFADRVTVKSLDGVPVGGWFAEDFTFAELKESVRARQSRDFRDPSFDDLFKIPSFEQVIELVQEVEAETGQEIGIYPETKHPTFFDEQGLSLEEPLIEVLQDTGFTDPDRIFIQSFEFQNLIELQGQLDAVGLGDIPLVQLYGNTTEGANPDSGFSFPFDIRFNVEQGNDLAAIYGQDFLDAAENPLSDTTVYGDLDSTEFLQVIGEQYAEGAGPWKNNILLRESLDTPVDGDGDGVAEITTQLTGEITSFIEDAHDAGMQVHPYTLRDEERFLTLEADGTPQTPEAEVEQLIQIGADGFFTDFPRTADPVRDALVADDVRSPQNGDFDFNTLTQDPPLVIAHRGTSGDFPEHTLEAYRAAIFQGADFIEPDLAITSDGVLIARHEPTLAQVELDENGEIALDENGDPIVLQNSTLTTNVADLPQFADRVTVKSLDGELVGGWFAEDFTLQEIKDEIRAVQSRDFRDQSFNGEFEIPTLEEVIELVQEVEAETGQEIGIYPETKHPTFFDEQGLSLEEPLVETLVETGFTNPDRIFIQSFELANLIELQETLDSAVVGSIDFIGEVIFETGFTFEDTEVGGLSGITYDAENDVYFSLSDDRSNVNDARFYDLTIDLSDGSLDDGDVGFLNVTTLTDENGDPFPSGSLDPEGIALTDEGTVFISSEGDTNNLIDPFVNNFGLGGQQLSELPVPEKFLPTEDGTSGVINNAAFESLTISPDNTVLYTATEASLIQDIPATLPEGSATASRIIQYDLVSGQPVAEFVYLTDSIPDSHGLVELLAIDDQGTLLALERSFTPDLGNNIRLYEINVSDATDVSDLDTLVGQDLEDIAVDKRLITDLGVGDEFGVGGDFGVDVDNDEAMTLGPILPDGSQSLIIVSDNNFNPGQETEFLAFSLDLVERGELGDLPLVQLYGDVEDDFINEGGGGFSVPFDIVANFSDPNFTEEDARDTYGNLVDIVPDFGEDLDGDGIPDTTYQDLANLDVFQQIGEDYAEGVGPWKNSFILRESLDTPVDGNGDGLAEITTQLTGEIRPFVDWARQSNLQVHPYTLRNEERFLTLEADGTPQTPGEEFEQLIEIGVDGFFTDFPATGSIILETIVGEPNLTQSRGFEGMAFSPDRSTAYPMLEGPVLGDPETSRRIYEFDLETGEYQDLIGFYGTEEPSHAIGDFTPINETEFLVIERDGSQADLDGFKKIFKIDISNIDEEGFVEKEEVVDLLNIPDPDDLNGDGETTYTMPFVTIEDVLVFDEETILVANDNNYPFSVGRPPEIDNNEIALIELDEPLDLDPRLGAEAEEIPELPEAPAPPAFGGLEDDILEAGLDFAGDGNPVFTGAGSDLVDASVGEGSNRLYSGSDDDELFAGTRDRLFGGAGNDILDATLSQGGNRLYGGDGDDDFFNGNDDRLIGGDGSDRFFLGEESGESVVTGGAGADQFWIANAGVPFVANIITDFIRSEDVLGVAGLGVTEIGDLNISQDGDDAAIAFNGDELAVLLGVDSNALTNSDFVFV